MSNSPELLCVKQGTDFDTYTGVVHENHHAARVVLKLPHDITDQHGILVAPGFTDGTAGPDYLTNYFAEQGRVAYTLDHPRTDDSRFKNDPEGHKARTLHLVSERIIEQFELEQKQDITAHSEGGGNSTRFALEHPEAVRSVTVMASGGLIEGDTQARILVRSMSKVGRLHREKIQEHLRNPLREIRIVGRSIGYVASNPQKAVKEALAISSHDIRYRFKLLRDADIYNAALQFGGDELFWLSLVNESTDNGSIFDLYTVYPHDPNAGHLTPQYHPRKVGKIVLDGINSMLLGNMHVQRAPKTVGRVNYPKQLSQAS